MKLQDKTILKNLCFSGFGTGADIAAVDIKDGKVARIRPLHYDSQYKPEDLNYWKIEARGKTFEPGFKSFLPPLSLSYKKRAHSPNRVPSPLKRVDWEPGGDLGKTNPQNRGISGYQPISWDEATDMIASEIDRVHQKYGKYAILAQGDGHGETKLASGAHGCQTMLLDHLGGYTMQSRQPDSWEGWYWGAKHVWGMDPVGQQTLQNNVVKDIAENGDAVLFWGCDFETTPWGWGGQMPSRIGYFFTEVGVKSIFVSPDLNYAGAVHNDKWIPVLPNTDAALQLAIAHVWISEGLYDEEYVATHVDGFDWLKYHVLGGDDGIEKTPAWAAEKCGVPSYTIKALARYWAKSAVSIAHCNGGGYIRSCYAHEPARLEVCLLGMQGIGKPGAQQFKMIEWNLMGSDSTSALPPGEFVPRPHAAYHGYNLMPTTSFIPKTLIHKAITNGGDKPLDWYGHVLCAMPRKDQFDCFSFPPEGCDGLHMIWSDCPCWQTCWNGGHEFQDALRSPNIECFVVQHPWMENDTLFADIILPVRTIWECHDLAYDMYCGQFMTLIYEEQAIEPVGSALSDYEAVGEVARALERLDSEKYADIYQKYTKGKTIDQDIQNGYENCGIDAEKYPFADFKERKFHLVPTREGWEEVPPGLRMFYEDPESYPLTTPTGKLEFYSTALAEKWPDDKIRGPYPKWIEEGDGHQERIHSKRAKEYPYLLVSNHPRWRVHAQLDDIPWLREIPTCKVKGPDGYLYEPIWVNPLDAGKLGLKDGDIAKLYNERGAVLGGVIVSERIMPGALYQDHGARVDSIVSGMGGLDRGGANNLICPSATTSKNAVGEVTNGFLVGIEKVDVFELAKQYPEAFARDYQPAVGLVASARIIKA